MDPTTITVTINSVSTELSLLSNLLVVLPVLLLLLFSAFIIFTLSAISTLKGEKSGIQSQTQAQQKQQQDSNAQQSSKEGVFVDQKTLLVFRDAFDFNAFMFLLIIVAILAAFAISANSYIYNLALAIIFALSLVGSFVSGYSSYKVNKVRPKKVRKIIKKIIIYEDGTTVEREKRYEY